MADFITIDIDSIINNQKPVADANPTTPNDGTETQAGVKTKSEQKNPTSRIDWSKELKKRLDTNKALDKEARIPDYDVEKQFWNDFFKANWPENVAEVLDNVIGEQLKKDIKILGFKKQTNPILAFLKLSYVQKELVLTKLLNRNTYKAIHNAVANQYVADSEFFKASDYNIIYCKDLYARSSNEIEAYLKIQKEVLPTNISEYTVDRQNRNKSIFLEVGKKSVKQKGVKLKSLKEVQKLTGISVEKTDDEDSTNSTEEKENNITLENQELIAFIGKSPAKAAATLQFIGMSSKNSKAFKELKNIGNVPMEALISATSDVASKLGGTKIDSKTAEKYITIIANEVIPYLPG